MGLVLGLYDKVQVCPQHEGASLLKKCVLGLVLCLCSLNLDKVQASLLSKGRRECVIGESVWRRGAKRRRECVKKGRRESLHWLVLSSETSTPDFGDLKKIWATVLCFFSCHCSLFYFSVTRLRRLEEDLGARARAHTHTHTHTHTLRETLSEILPSTFRLSAKDLVIRVPMCC